MVPSLVLETLGLGERIRGGFDAEIATSLKTHGVSMLI